MIHGECIGKFMYMHLWSNLARIFTKVWEVRVPIDLLSFSESTLQSKVQSTPGSPGIVDTTANRHLYT